MFLVKHCDAMKASGQSGVEDDVYLPIALTGGVVFIV